MRSLIKQLKLKNFEDVYIINKPNTFIEIFNDIEHSESIVTTSCIECGLVFTETKEAFAEQMLTLFPRLLDASVIWVFYPNNTSISTLSELHREFDWDFLGDYRLKPTKLIHVDSTWNAIKIKKARV